MLKIAISGPESSGKTTLAMQLAKELDACLVEEYARHYLSTKGTNYSMEDLMAIADKQYSLNRGTHCQKEVLVCDTEMTVIKIWAMDKFGYCPGEINTLLEQQHFDLLFLCKPDIPWEPDPLRQDSHRRNFLFQWYAEELFWQDVNYTLVHGAPQQRIDIALRAVSRYLSAKS